MPKTKTAFVHYTAPPVVGGVEAVLEAHARAFLDAGYPVKMIVGRGESEALPEGVELAVIPEMDTQHPDILEISAALEEGRVPDEFLPMRDRLIELLRPELADIDVVIVHNVFSKHFNLPLTAALARLVEEGAGGRCLAWGHDFSWTSPNSRSKVFPGYPWNLLKSALPGIKYITISEQRRLELAGLLDIPAEEIAVVYNGVDPKLWYGLSEEGWRLVKRMSLLSGDLILIMPVRVTQAKNIEFAEQVLAAIKDAGCRPRLVITGPPDPHSDASQAYYQSLLDQRERLGLEKDIRFVYELGEDPGEPNIITQPVVADLLRVSDVLFMPSHREGFGMPVLEAGLVGAAIVCSEMVPAAKEIGGDNIFIFAQDAEPREVARLILDSVADTPAQRFRRQVRQTLTWDTIFEQRILPLLEPPGDGETR